MGCNVGDEVQYRQQKAVVQKHYIENGVAYIVISPPFVFSDMYKSCVREDEVVRLQNRTLQVSGSRR